MAIAAADHGYHPSDVSMGCIRAISRRSARLPLGIALAGLLVNVIVATRMAATADEEYHLRYGVSVLGGSFDRSFRAFDSKMPVTALNAIPRVTAEALQRRGVAAPLWAALRAIRAARFATIAAAFCLSLLVYAYASSMYGRPAGIAAQILLGLSPTAIAHSTVATTDLYCALAVVGALFLLRRFLRTPTFRTALVAATALALAQLTKFVAAYLYLALLLILAAVAASRRLGRQTPPDVPRLRGGMLLALSALAFLVVVNLGFLFDRTFTPLTQYTVRSETFQRAQHIPLLNRIPLPVPYPYVHGFDWMRYHDDTGESFGNIALLGHVRGEELDRSDGFASYYVLAYALKEPIGLQLLLLAAIAWLARHRRPSDTITDEVPLLVTAGVLIVALSLFSNTQIGIRHLLPVLVILAILSGAAFAGWQAFSRRRRLLLTSCVFYAAVSIASYFPHMIPYFNEWVPDRKMAYRYLGDSNLDWGQDAWVVEDYLRQHPEVRLNPPAPTTGWILVSANLMAGVIPPTADYWARARGLTPSAHVGYAHLLIWVPPEK